ncbi:MAG: hypothetical protein ACXVBW_09795, partial [Bdellovibrionota bacterium]
IKILAVVIAAGVLCPAFAADPAPAAKPVNKSKYRRSKTTSDETEALADRRRMLLTTGEDRHVDIDFDVASHDAIVEGNKQVVVAQLVKVGDKRQIVFKPLKAGETTVTVRDTEGTVKLIFWVRVTGSNLLRVSSEVRDLLRDIEGIDIRVVGPKVIIEGEVLVPSDYARLLNVIQDKAYVDFVMNLATLSPMAMQVLAKRIEEDIHAFAPNVHTRVVNGMIFLEGTTDNIDQARRSASVASLYLPEERPGNPLDRLDPTVQAIRGRSLIQNFIVVNPPPPKKQEKLVRITVHFVELSKDYNKVFAFKWEPGFTSDPQIQIGQSAAAGGAAAAAGASFSATLSSLIPKLASAQTAGYARVLKTGTVIVRSGQPAKLSEVTEFPFTIPGQNGQTQSASKDVGLVVAVTPLILGQSEDIQLDLNMQQSNVVGRTPAGTAPVSAKHEVQTKLYVKSAESAAVAAVTSSQVGTDFNKFDPTPGNFAGQTDPLFSLLHSKQYDKKKSQFVIFVTPQIVENASDGTDDLKKNFRVKVK